MLYFRWEDLAGWTVQHMEVVEAGERLNIRAVRDGSERLISFYAEGDCCAHAYIDEDSRGEVGDVVGGTIIEASERYVDDEHHKTDDERRDSGDCHDLCFYLLRTTAGDVTLTLHIEHNGYYGGRLTYDIRHSEGA